MPKRMLIDASHPEETRVVVIDGNRVEEFDFEAASKRPLKGNIYLAKVTRVEPSLQAAFVEYGGNRQGFLAFSEIHPDYYQIPVADRMAILQAQTARMMAEDDIESIDARHPDESATDGEEPRDDNGEDRPTESAAEHTDDREHSVVADDGSATEAVDRHASPAPDETASPAAETKHESEPVAELSEVPEPASQPQDSPPRDASSEIMDLIETAQNEAAAASESTRETVQAESTGAPVAWQRPEHQRHGDRPRPRRRQYKIQEVIKRRQVMLVQVVKEERGNKGASLTTFLSLAGRYCVLMPNTPRGGGISRKITNAADRKRLKSAAQTLDLPEGMGLIIRTAGANRTKVEIKRDYEYLLRLWDTVRELTLKSNAPALVYEEGSLIKRAIRDLYSKEISEVVVDGEAGYREAKEFMRMLMPSHAKNVKIYREPLPLFQKLQVESQLDAMFSPVVHLRSGGYIVINQTEALVSIDVNSGKATREHSIEETALKTNLEAADEIARQLRLRDLAGLIVIDFIDMEDSKNDRSVEKRLHNAVRNDRARIQIGRISQFGLLELSRQRLRAGVVAGSTVTCPHCNGQGIVRSTESAALRLLRALDEEGQRQNSVNLTVKTPSDVAIYTLNQKRREVARIEEAYDVGILFEPQANMVSGSFEIQRTGMRVPAPRPKLAAISVEGGFQSADAPEQEPDVTIVEPPELPVAAEPAVAAEPDGTGPDGRGRKRRKRRRGGRGRSGRVGGGNGEQEIQAGEAESLDVVQDHEDNTEGGDADLAAEPASAETPPQSGAAAANGEGEHRRRRRRRGRRGRRFDHELPGSGQAAAPEEKQAGDSTVIDFPQHANPAEEAEISPSHHHATAEAEDLTSAVPNSPSSPVWSLLDHAPAEAIPESSPVPARASEHAEPAAERDIVHSTPEPIPATAEAEAPRESRKGWWQRRFKA